MEKIVKKASKQPGLSSDGLMSKLMFLVLGGIVLVWALAAFQEHRNADRPHRTHRTASESHIAPEPFDVGEVRASQYALLRTIVGQDPEGLELLAFFDRHSRYGMLAGNGMLMGLPTVSVGEVSPDDDPMNFTVVVSTRREREQNGLTSVSPWEFEHSQALLFVPPDLSDLSEQAAGAIFAHELRHAYDHAHGLQPVEATRREVIEGERRAYSLEIRLLDLANEGRISSAIETILAGRTEWPAPPSTCLYMTDLSTEEKRQFFSAMPSLVEEDMIPLVMLLPIELNLRLADRNEGGVEAQVTCLDRLLEHQAGRTM
jgi:hypothetical protein